MARRAVAESCGILFDGKGQLIADGLQQRAVGVTAEQLRRTPEVIALATESERLPAIRAMTRSGIVTTLITHRQLADRALADAGA
jgi:DNA-binding transcriptional regulator LsrR (DeoR family)